MLYELICIKDMKGIQVNDFEKLVVRGLVANVFFNSIKEFSFFCRDRWF